MRQTYRRHRYQLNAIIVALLLTVAVWVAVSYLSGWRPYFTWLIAVSVATFFLIGVDKALSKSDRARIPESVLHLFTLLGGFTGQFLGRRIFRHKTNFKRHPSFTIVLVISLVLHAVLTYIIW